MKKTMVSEQIKKAEVKDWVEVYSKELVAWAEFRTKDTELAKDLVQDTFIVAYEKFESFRNLSTPKTWLIGILNNKISTYFASRKRSIDNLEIKQIEQFDKYGNWLPEFMPKDWQCEEQSLLDNVEFTEVLFNCINATPNAQRQVIEMKYLSDKDSKVICEDMNITQSNLWQLIFRAKLFLRKCLETKWFGQ